MIPRVSLAAKKSLKIAENNPLRKWNSQNKLTQIEKKALEEVNMRAHMNNSRNRF